MQHRFKNASDGITCEVCGWRWNRNRISTRGCPGVKRYAADEVPAELKSAAEWKRLGRQMLSGHAAGCYWSDSAGWVWLFRREDTRVAGTR